MGPGPLFYSGTYCGCLSALHNMVYGNHRRRMAAGAAWVVVDLDWAADTGMGGLRGRHGWLWRLPGDRSRLGRRLRGGANRRLWRSAAVTAGLGVGSSGSPFQQSVGGIGFGGYGGLPGIAGYMPCCGWYAQAGVLIMHRDKPNPVWTTFDETNLNNQLMNTQNASAGTGYGGQITIGHCLGANCAIEGTYWGLTSMTGYSQIVSPTNSIGTVLDDSFLPAFGNGVLPGNYFDAAHEQAMWRTDNFQNMELNVLTYPCINPMSRFRMAASVVSGTSRSPTN